MQLIPYHQPLPAQRWGILPTNQFWAHAFLTSAGVALWGGLSVYMILAEAMGLSWWGTALCWMVVYSGWGGLLERWTRRALVARRRRLLLEELDRTGTVSSLLAPAELPRMPPLGASPEFRDFAYQRLFGRGTVFVQGAQSIGFTLLVFYPSWIAFVLAMLLLFGESIALGRWERRFRRARHLTEADLASPRASLAHVTRDGGTATIEG